MLQGLGAESCSGAVGVCVRKKLDHRVQGRGAMFVAYEVLIHC